MSGNPDRSLSKSNKTLDLHQGLTSKRGKENSPHEDGHESEHDQSRSPDGFPRLSGSNRTRGSRSDSASEFWSQGLAKLKALDTRSNGNGKDSETATLIKESCNPPPERDTTKFASINPRNELHRPRLLFFPEPDILSAISSERNNQAQPLPDSCIPMSNKIPNIKDEPKNLPLVHPLRLPALDVGVVDQSLDLEAKKCRSHTPASVSCPSTESLIGNQYESSNDTDAIPSHTEPVKITGIACVKSEDCLPVRPAIQGIEPAMPMDPSPKSKNSCMSVDSGLSPPKPRQTLETPSKPSNTPKHSGLSSVGPTPHLFEPRSIVPITPNTPRRKMSIEHLKSLSADASAGHSSPPSGAPTAPRSFERHKHKTSVSPPAGAPTAPRSFERHKHQTSVSPPAGAPTAPRSFERHKHKTSVSPPAGAPTAPRSFERHDHERSVSLGSGQLSHSYMSVMPKTPCPQRNPRHLKRNSMRTLPIPSESGIHINLGGSSQPSPAHLYPASKQHTPEGQGQCLDVQGSMSFSMPAQFSYPISPNGPPFPSSLHSFHNNTIHQNAQVYKQGEQNPEYSQSNHFDSYATSQAANATPNTADLHQNGNIYTQDTNSYGPRYYSNHTDPTHQASLCPLRKDHAKLIKTQLNQNLYSPLEPHREPSKPNQRTAKDMFIPEDLRLKLHARTEATLRVFAGKLLRYRISLYAFADIHPSGSFSNEHTRRRTLPYPYAFDSR